MRPQPAIQSAVVEGEGVLGAIATLGADQAASFAEESAPLDERIYAAQEDFAALASTLSESNASTYVGAGLGESHVADAWLAFTTMPDDRVLELVRALPIDVEVRWGYAATQAERIEAIDVAAAVLTEELGAGAPFSAVPDLLGIEIAFRWDDGEPSGDLIDQLQESVLSATAESSLDGLAPLPVTVEYNAHLAGELEANEVWGGGQLRLTNGDSICTSGWSARRGGREGIITAGHCPNLLRWGFNAGWIQFVADRPVTPNGNWVDMQFHQTLAADAVPKFRSTSMSTFRLVLDVANPVYNQRVCHWGMVTGTGCTIVVETFGCYRYDGDPRAYCGLAFTSRHITAGGDSGGPWYSGQTAVGTHTGSADHDDNPSTPLQGIFTMISMANTYLSATILEA